MPPQRSKKTCYQCRARKTRCGGGPVPCAPCARLTLPCSFDTRITRRPGSDMGDVIAVSTKQTFRACDWCRSRKSKCSGGNPCALCQSRDRRCTYSRQQGIDDDNTGSSERRGRDDEQVSSEADDGVSSNPRLEQTRGTLVEESATHNSPRNRLLRTYPGTDPALFQIPPDAIDGRPQDTGRDIEPDRLMTGGSPPANYRYDSLYARVELPASSDISRSPVGESDLVSTARRLPPTHDQMHLIIEYFLYIYPIPKFSFLSREVITKECLAGTLKTVLALALCAVSVQRLPHPIYTDADASAWISQAEKTILLSLLDSPSITIVEGLLLITQFRIYAGDFRKAFMVFSLASRTAFALGLNYEETSSDLAPVALESRRRIMWALMMMDIQISVGRSEYELCPYEMIHVEWPCREKEFETRETSLPSGSAINYESPEDILDGSNLLSLAIRESRLRRDILRLTRQLPLAAVEGSSAGMRPGQLESIVDDMCLELQRVTIMPDYSIECLKTYACTRWLPRFIMAHLAWHQCFCDITRLFLYGYVEGAPRPILNMVSRTYIRKTVRTCLFHARAISRIIRDLGKDNYGNGEGISRRQLKALDIDVAICGYHASRILLFASTSKFCQELLREEPDEDLFDLYTDAVTSDATARRDEVAEATVVLQFLRSQFTSLDMGRQIIRDLEKVIFQAASARLDCALSPLTPLSSATEHRDGHEGWQQEEGDNVEASECPDTSTPGRSGVPSSMNSFGRAINESQRLGVHSIIRLARFRDVGHSANPH